MWIYRIITTSALAMLMMNVSVSQASDLSLKQLRQKLLGKSVEVSSMLISNPKIRNNESVLSGWCVAKPDKHGGYKSQYNDCNAFNAAPYTVQGGKGKIVAIGLIHLSGEKKNESSDIFGDPLKENNPINPYVNIFVRLGSGRSLKASGYFRAKQNGEFLLESELDKVRPVIYKQLDSVIGRTLFSVGYSLIYSADTQLPELADVVKRKTHIIDHIPNLTPLKIVKAKYLENYHAIVTKVSFLDDQLGLIYSDLRYYSPERIAKTFIDIVGSSTLTGTDKLTEREITAIRQEKVFRGMSEDAAQNSWGDPDKENDYGAAGKQLIYGTQYIYLKDGVVENFQSLDK